MHCKMTLLRLIPESSSQAEFHSFFGWLGFHLPSCHNMSQPSEAWSQADYGLQNVPISRFKTIQHNTVTHQGLGPQVFGIQQVLPLLRYAGTCWTSWLAAVVFSLVLQCLRCSRACFKPKEYQNMECVLLSCLASVCQFKKPAKQSP